MKTFKELLDDNIYSTDLYNLFSAGDEPAIMKGIEDNILNLDVDEDTAFIYELGNVIACPEEYFDVDNMEEETYKFFKMTLDKYKEYLIHRCDFMSFKDAFFMLDDFLIENNL